MQLSQTYGRLVKKKGCMDAWLKCLTEDAAFGGNRLQTLSFTRSQGSAICIGRGVTWTDALRRTGLQSGPAGWVAPNQKVLQLVSCGLDYLVFLRFELGVASGRMDGGAGAGGTFAFVRLDFVSNGGSLD